jgi:hypothetical protein
MTRIWGVTVGAGTRGKVGWVVSFGHENDRS